MVNPTEFDWNQFQRPSDLKEPVTEIQQEETQEQIEDKPPFQWGDYQTPNTYQGEPDPTAEESGIGWLVRNLASNASRFVEAQFGRFGDYERLGKNVLSSYPAAGGILSLAAKELLGQERWDRLLGTENQNLPTTSQLKEASEQLTGSYTKAKTPGEEITQEFVSDVGSVFNPGRKAVQATGKLAKIANNPLLRDSAIAGFANIGKQATKGLGFDEEKANYAKMGIWTILTLLDKVNAPKYASNLMNEGRKGFNPTLQADVPRYQKNLQKIQNSPNLLISDPRTNLARNQINLLNQNIANGQNSIQSLLTSYDGVNAAKRSSGMFELTKPSDRRFASHALDQVLGVVREEINKVGASNPEALKKWHQGLNAWRVVHESNALSNWIESLAKGPYAKVISGPASGLFGLAGYGTYQQPLLGAVAGATAYTGNKLFQVGYRVMNDDVLRDYYIKAISAAMKQDAPVFIKNYNKLNKELEKKEKKEKREN
jgi:hypothetical protein